MLTCPITASLTTGRVPRPLPRHREGEGRRELRKSRGGITGCARCRGPSQSFCGPDSGVFPWVIARCVLSDSAIACGLRLIGSKGAVARSARGAKPPRSTKSPESGPAKPPTTRANEWHLLLSRCPALRLTDSALFPAILHISRHRTAERGLLVYSFDATKYEIESSRQWLPQ